MAKTILIADDQLADIESLQRVLNSANVQNPVRVVRDGVETIAYLDGVGPFANRAAYPYPAILFLDLRMPKISGVEVLEYLQDQPQHRDLGVVVFTAFGDVSQIRQAYQLGASSFLVKPVTLGDFQNLVTCLNGIEVQACPNGYLLDFANKSLSLRHG
jgi:CheY-like chemotaxis protein